jgi:hypothetical protein
MHRTMRLAVLALGAALTACTTTTGITTTGADTFSISGARMAGPDPKALDAKLLRDAEAFCSKRGQKVEVVSEVPAATKTVRDQGSLAFKCVPG